MAWCSSGGTRWACRHSAQTLAVVPSDSQIEIEAMVSNRDIGFVHAGQDAEIKIDTFNFTRYGLLHSRIVGISPDSVSGPVEGRAA